MEEEEKEEVQGDWTRSKIWVRNKVGLKVSVGRRCVYEYKERILRSERLDGNSLFPVEERERTKVTWTGNAF